MNRNFEKDEIVICVINAKASLTQFKEYKVLSESYGEISIVNDYDETLYYTRLRFIKKSEMREIKINKILND